MVDFTKRLKNKSVPQKTDPIEIYDSIDRRSETGPLRPSQYKVLKEWFENRSSKRDNIVKLHTGEGKTLIGLLILQSKINSDRKPCLYICPNKYLAEQVQMEAQKFGIPTAKIGEDNDLPDDFLSGEKILISHVQKVFNGKTIFGLANKSIPMGTILLDDSHACIDSIKSSLTVKVSRDHPLYKYIFSLFASDIRDQGEGSYLEIESGVYNTMLPIPYWAWQEKISEITKSILDYKDDNEIQFSWPLIKNRLQFCQAFISGRYLEISPSLIPIEDFAFFHKADQRILMSATTQDDSFFIKGLGFDVKSLKDPLSNKDLKWSGEKMVLMPSLMDPSLDREEIVNWLGRKNDKVNFGIVFLTPGFGTKTQYENVGADVAKSDNIFEKVKNLKDGKFSIPVVFANRYDGIDLPDQACRILVIDSKPYFDSLLDTYEESCRADSDIMNIKIAQKIEQGLGRSVRGEKDYSVILIVGGDLVKFLKSPTTSKYFSAQTKRQIQIGMEVTKFALEDSSDKPMKSVLVELINQALQRDTGWKEYYQEEMEKLIDVTVTDSTYDTLIAEYRAEQQLAVGNYQEACRIIQSLCDSSNFSREEKGWYLQQIARYTYFFNKVEAEKFQLAAFKSNLQLLKPRGGIDYNKINFINENRTKRIRQWIAKHPTHGDLMIHLDGILSDLSFGMPAEKFEAALREIGEVLGFLSQRPDKEIKKGPDNLWCGIENEYLFFECKSEVEETRAAISKHEAGQMNTHSGWFDNEYATKNVRRILIIPTRTLSYYADLTHHIEIMRKHNLSKLKQNIRAFFMSFSSYVITDLSDEAIQEQVDANKLDMNSLKSEYCEPPIKSNDKSI